MHTTKNINFDDINTQLSTKIPDGYEGFNWISYDPLEEVLGGDVHVSTGGRALTSGTHSVKGFGFQIKRVDGDTFDVQKAVLAADSGFVDAGANMDVTIIGKLGGTEIFNKVFNGDKYGQGPLEVNIYCNGVDEILIYASAIEEFDIDNIVVTTCEAHKKQ